MSWQCYKHAAIHSADTHKSTQTGAISVVALQLGMPVRPGVFDQHFADNTTTHMVLLRVSRSRRHPELNPGCHAPRYKQ